MLLQNKILNKIVERDRIPYPRYYLRLYPKAINGLIQNQQELYRFMMFGKDAFVRLFSEYQIAEREFDMLYLDIDDKDLHVAFVKLESTLEQLRKHGVKRYLINFSGSKGFHIYIPFEPVRLFNYRKTVMAWLNKVGALQFLDASALEPRRVMRLPATVNTKSGLHCITLGNDLHYSFKQVIERSIDNQLEDFDLIYNVGISKEFLNIDGKVATEQAQSKPQTVESESSKLFTDITTFPPCMKRLVMLAVEGVDLNHTERMEMGIFLNHVFGGDVEKVALFYSKMSDYNPSVTKYHLQYLIDNKQKLMRCDNLNDFDICCEDKTVCPFYDTINKYIAKDNLLKINKHRA